MTAVAFSFPYSLSVHVPPLAVLSTNCELSTDSIFVKLFVNTKLHLHISSLDQTSFCYNDKVPERINLKRRKMCFGGLIPALLSPVTLGLRRHNISWREHMVRRPVCLIMARKLKKEAEGLGSQCPLQK